MVKLLIFIEAFIPGFKYGGPTQSIYNLVKLLTNHLDVYVVTLNKDYRDEQEYKGIEANVWIKNDELSCSILYLEERLLTLKKVKEIYGIISPDTIYLNSLWSRKFSLLPILAAKFYARNMKIVLNPRGELYEGALNIKPNRKKVLIFLLKAINFNKLIYWNATNQEEKNKIVETFGVNSKVLIFSNVPRQVQIDYVSRYKEAGTCKIVFLSRVSPIKNLDFSLRIARNCEYKLILDVYGPLDEKYWGSCQDIIKDMPRNVSVQYKGVVSPNKVLEVLSTYHFLILPTKGENFGHAIFDSFLSGLPVIISNNTPWLFLENKGIGFDIPLESPGKWLDVFNKVCLMGQKEFDALSLNAYNFASDYNKDNLLLIEALEVFG